VFVCAIVHDRGVTNGWAISNDFPVGNTRTGMFLRSSLIAAQRVAE